MLHPPFIDVLACTAAPLMHDPEFAPFLHGEQPPQREVQVVWRADLDEEIFRRGAYRDSGYQELRLFDARILFNSCRLLRAKLCRFRSTPPSGGCRNFRPSTSPILRIHEIGNRIGTVLFGMLSSGAVLMTFVSCGKRRTLSLAMS